MSSARQTITENTRTSRVPAVDTDLSDHLKDLVKKLCKPFSVELVRLDKNMLERIANQSVSASGATDPHSNDSCGLANEVELITLDSDEEPEKGQSVPLDSSPQLNVSKGFEKNVGNATQPEMIGVDCEDETSTAGPVDRSRLRRKRVSFFNGTTTAVKVAKRQHLVHVLNESIKWSRNSFNNINSAMRDMEGGEDEADFELVRLHLQRGLHILQNHAIHTEGTIAIVAQQQVTMEKRLVLEADHD